MGNPKFHYYIRKNLWIIRVLRRIQSITLASFFEICFITSYPLSLDLSDRFLSILLPMKILYVFIMSVMHTTYLFHGSAFM